jgi:hypothetical protein
MGDRVDINDFAPWIAFYEAKGLTTIPLFGIMNGTCLCKDGADCNSPGKHPKKKWVKEGPGPFREGDNLGISTDPLVVIDIDYDGLEEVRTELDLPETFTTKTGKGYHLWFEAHPDVKAKSVTGILPRVDVRAIGGIIVVPPSRTATGGRYVRHSGSSFTPIPDHVMDRIPQKGDDLQKLQILDEKSEEVTPEQGVSLVEHEVMKVFTAQSGNRNGVLFEAACRVAEYVSFGYAGLDAFVSLRVAAEQIGLTRDEADRTIQSARYEVNKK